MKIRSLPLLFSALALLGGVPFASAQSLSQAAAAPLRAGAPVQVYPPTARESAPAAPQRIDETLFTTYSISADQTSLSYLVCGSTQNSGGCFSSGTFGTFGKVAAILEGKPTTDLSTGTVTRPIYVLDGASGANGDGVSLSVFTKTDVITPDFDFVTVALAQTVPLPLAGGTNAVASMAANAHFLFIGTDKSPQAVRLSKVALTPTPIGGFSPPINVVAITADQYGYVAITFGGIRSGGETGFYLYGPDGNLAEDGGGAQFTVGTMQAILPGALP